MEERELDASKVQLAMAAIAAAQQADKEAQRIRSILCNAARGLPPVMW